MTFPPANPAHPLYGRFFQAARDGYISLPSCDSCGHVFWPPAETCSRCLSERASWIEVPGVGTVWGIAEYHHAYLPGLSEELPYRCVLVELDTGQRLVSRLVPDDAYADVGTRVVCARISYDENQSVPCFSPSSL